MWTGRRLLLVFSLLVLLTSAAFSQDVVLSRTTYNQLVENLTKLEIDLQVQKELYAQRVSYYQTLVEQLENSKSSAQREKQIIADLKTNLQSERELIEKQKSYINDLEKQKEELSFQLTGALESLTNAEGSLKKLEDEMKRKLIRGVVISSVGGVALGLAGTTIYFLLRRDESE